MINYKYKLIVSLRRLYLSARFFGCPIHVHPTSWISSKSIFRICGGGGITIGEQCDVHPYSMFMTYGGHIKIGNNCSINPFTIIYGHGGTCIGNSVRIAAHTVIIPANHKAPSDDVPLYQSGSERRGISIEDNVWIGAGVHILDGVAIGRNTIVGAGSVVTKSLPANVTAAGVPARIINTRT